MNLDLVINGYFSQRLKIIEVWKYVQDNPDFTTDILTNIDEAVELFNKYKNGEEIINSKIPLKSASYLKTLLESDLPHVKELFNVVRTREELVNEILGVINNFEFIEELEPIERCAGVLMLGAYRSAILVIYPELKEKNAQVASSLEEMLAIMALNGNKTKLFEYVKPWFENYQEEGFSKELSEAVLSN